jgi:hypothetical protein
MVPPELGVAVSDNGESRTPQQRVDRHRIILRYGRHEDPDVSVKLWTERGPGEKGPEHTICACIDSGAGRTLFPKGHMHLLGLREEDLRRDVPDGHGVTGEPFPTWSSEVPIRAQVYVFNDATRETVQFGPEFGVQPGFYEPTPRVTETGESAMNGHAHLLGRLDFFPGFTITFHQVDGQPFVALAYGLQGDEWKPGFGLPIAPG